MYSEITPDDGQRNSPKYVELTFQNKFEKKIVYLVGFIIRKFVTMHGHTNVKFVLYIISFVGEKLKFVSIHDYLRAFAVAK
jgi:hypothetical protein